MKTLSALFVLTALSTAAAEVPQFVGGKVYLDANGNGRLDPGEKGISNVRVTDGVDFVVTGEDGSYTIQPARDPAFKYRPAQTVSICWPSGKWPTGKYWVRLAYIADAKSVHFGLRDDPQSLPFMYLQHSDSHCRFHVGCDSFAEFVNRLGRDVKFVLDTGDTSFGSEGKDGPTTFRVLAEAEKKFRVPFLHTIGNHDVMPPESGEQREGFGAWTQDMGPMRWSFDYADVHFAGIDCFEEEIRPAVADWLEKDFKAQPKGRRIVLSYHYPNPDGKKFHSLLKDYNVQLIHAGHNHSSEYWDWHAPMVTVFDYKPLGDCNAMVVTPDAVLPAYYCLGCKGKPFVHSRRCPMGWESGVLLTNVEKLFGQVVKIENQALAGARDPVAVSTSKVLIQAEIAPGTAQRVGLRIGSKGPPVEVAFTGDHLVIGGAPLRFDILQPSKLLRLTVFVQKGLVTVWADGYFFMEKPIQAVDGTITVFAEGGTATIKTMRISEVKPAPGDTQGGYRNNDVGRLRRMPD